MRSRIYELPSGRYVTIWETRRTFATREEALAAAEQPLPTAPQGPLRIDPRLVQLAARLHDEAGYSWRTVAVAFDQMGIRAPRGGPWRGNSISGAVQRAREKRAEHDRRAVHSEWNVEQNQDGPANS